jgi:hypothetical protein
MSVNYYLFCKKSYDKIICHLDNIINIFEEIDEFSKEENDVFKSDIVLSNQLHNINFFYNRKEHIQVLRDICKKNLIEKCSHQFIEDTIDIDPDRSKNIRYCSICEYTETN